MANNKPTNYMCWVFFLDKQRYPIHFPYVKSIYFLHKYLNGQNKSGLIYPYHYINIYHRKSGVFLKRQYYDVHIDDKPAF